MKPREVPVDVYIDALHEILWAGSDGSLRSSWNEKNKKVNDERNCSCTCHAAKQDNTFGIPPAL
jgi:hypothetical protein